MERVVVIGCSGAGKSRLATQLGARLGLPVVHLDRLFWKPGWVESTRAEFEARQLAALPADGRWIADGNFVSTMALRLVHADTIVLLDLPTHVCLGRAVMRAVRGLGKTRPDMGVDCPEHIFRREYLEFLRYILNFRVNYMPRVWAAIAAHGRHARLHQLRSDDAVAQFLDAITPAAAETANRRAARE
jgi:adenylate kinase family enzyme